MWIDKNTGVLWEYEPGTEPKSLFSGPLSLEDDKRLTYFLKINEGSEMNIVFFNPEQIHPKMETE